MLRPTDGDEVDADVGVLGRLEVVDEERQQRDGGDEEDDGDRGREARSRAALSSHPPHRGAAEEALRAEVENAEDDDEPAHEPHLAAEEVDVRAQEVER